MWHPFDDSRVLNYPNATEKGLRRPLEVASESHMIKISHLVSFAFTPHEIILIKWVSEFVSDIPKPCMHISFKAMKMI